MYTKELSENHLIPSFGDMLISTLKAIHIQKLLSELFDKGYAPETIKKIYNVLRNSLEYACDMDLIPKNYATKIKVPTQGKKKKIVVWAEGFLEVAKEDRYFMAFHLALMTGMRQGEVLGLKWKDVDLEKGVLSTGVKFEF